MILDSKEIYVEPDIPKGTEILKDVGISSEGIERGERGLRIPEGIRKIDCNAFQQYNTGAVVSNIMNVLSRHNAEVREWMKKLRRKNLVKITFPEEAGDSVSGRAEFLVKKEERVRLLKLDLPASLAEAEAGAFPVLLEQIDVSEQNPNFTSVDGVMFSKDRKTLLRYPGLRSQEYQIPEGTECIAEGAFSGAVLKRLELPSTLRRIENQAFRAVYGLEDVVCKSQSVSMGTSVFRDSVLKSTDWWVWEEIPKATFLNCALLEIAIPEGVTEIRDYAFAGCRRVKRIIIPSSVEIIDRHSFEEGNGFSAEVQLPRNLFRYAYRFPPLTEINGKPQREIWKSLSPEERREEPDVLSTHRESLKRQLSKLRFMNLTAKRKMKAELELLSEIG
ncbi:hypothetical protein BHK98_08670 [Hornefia porci]|uniref:Leucine-rich repeat domain-containing protein n=1 Tax=Hornefia porci TaxID=2652292 RepID=A0A1Q9JJ17_9FIRM|nr:leucine-rich repeat domain-containing protein [Hornefia porci]OLR56131.1 hypothetical protein BHK98_08670 [Hornefia porci]